ncbi:MAG TPA: hypothetical protein VF098_04900 [Sphingomicrobium sp.]|jgi:hypothetical protein
MEGAPACVNPSLAHDWGMLAGVKRGGHVDEMSGKDKERDERLAAALRENLRRRKAQSREIGAADKGRRED